MKATKTMNTKASSKTRTPWAVVRHRGSRCEGPRLGVSFLGVGPIGRVGGFSALGHSLGVTPLPFRVI
jgi:hypothetical protein